ncbi:SBBP repeat-containing protein [Mechercharimyces sp. CAU 1602]|uniref:SBBP repeat-containing protein n=1 Tax=Mechercharimyces sp. CAU 1602 TaxID=2973933 RepID=UPI0021626D41|nr:SBBP repeat-containing protein [Mechercharimyces sp. CAU 1602]MCS1350823.1 SBBP repeat-containing protein [Mechercharimyces sp. CAU 1602]
MNTPIVFFSTYLGGQSNDCGIGIAVDQDEFAYVTGATSSDNFPVTSGAFQTVLRGGVQTAFITKFNPNGTSLIYSTFLGGALSDFAMDIDVDESGSAYIAGVTSSSNFPVTSGAFQTLPNPDINAFVTKLNESGSSLVYSTYLGMSGEDSANGIAVDTEGLAYVVGTTFASGFPVTSGAFQTLKAGFFDVFITKFNASGSALIYSTLLGGGGADNVSNVGTGIAIDEEGFAYVTGRTDSAQFPVTSGAFQTQGGNVDDGFVTKLNQTGTALVYSSYLGGRSNDQCNAIAIDREGGAYVTGVANSANFPVTSGAFQTIVGVTGGAVFVTRFNRVGSDLSYSTLLTGNDVSEGTSIAVDSLGGAWVTGGTEARNFPVTDQAIQRRQRGESNLFITHVNVNGSGLDFSTYYGGEGINSGFAITLDESENVYVTGETTAFDFPVTPGAFQSQSRTGLATSDAFVAKLGEVEAMGARGATGAKGAQGTRGIRGARGARGASSGGEG